MNTCKEKCVKNTVLSLDEWKALRILAEKPMNIELLCESLWEHESVSKSVVYSILESLKCKGLLNVINVGRKRIYTVVRDKG